MQNEKISLDEYIKNCKKIPEGKKELLLTTIALLSAFGVCKVSSVEDCEKILEKIGGVDKFIK
jgi:hypothetical protein